MLMNPWPDPSAEGRLTSQVSQNHTGDIFLTSCFPFSQMERIIVTFV
jgi:hypothetical protein